MFFSKNKHKNKIIISRVEYVDIPCLNLKKISAKIDTGAYRGAIHANDIKEVVKNGKKILQFHILDESNPKLFKKPHEAEQYSVKKFRGTKVGYHDRFVIPLEIIIKGERITAELSLTDRGDLRHPVLLGRRALKNRFLIDVDKKY